MEETDSDDQASATNDKDTKKRQSDAMKISNDQPLVIEASKLTVVKQRRRIPMEESDSDNEASATNDKANKKRRIPTEESEPNAEESDPKKIGSDQPLVIEASPILTQSRGQIPMEKTDSDDVASDPNNKASEQDQAITDPDFKASRTNDEASDPNNKASEQDQANTDPDFKASRTHDEVQAKAGALHNMVEDHDDDSFVLVTPKVGGKALFEFQNGGDTLSKERTRKHTDFFKTPPQKTIPLGSSAANKVYGIKPGDIWWTGDASPQMPGFGETNPLYAELFDKKKTMASIEAFAAGNLKHSDEREPGDYQVSREACFTYINRSLGRPMSLVELDQKCATFQSKESEFALRKWYKSTEVVVQTALNLSLLKNEVRLKYIPTPSSRASKWEQKERGYYEALVTIKDESSRDMGRTILYTPTNDWVEDNFTAESLAIVQQVTRETKTIYKFNGSSKIESGFIPLKKSLKYIDADAGVTRQISKMRYLPPRTAKNAFGKSVPKKEEWRGLIIIPRSDVSEQVTLDQEWVNDNIDEPMRKFLREVRIKDGHTGFVFIPEGDSEGHQEGAIQFEPNAPDIVSYISTNGTDSRRCVLDSTISGMRFLGLKRLAKLLSGTKDDVSKTANPMMYLRTFFQTKMDKAERSRMQYMALGRKRMKTWNMILSPKEYILCVLGIESSDGKTDHAICIVDGWIFDSTFKKALVLSAESLDICSSDSDRSTKFSRCTRGHLLKARQITLS
jgi:hypothetical protein